MLKSIEKMLHTFDENNIIYCHWKSNEHLIEALNGETDLDILFLPEQRAKLDEVLNICGLKRFRNMPLMQYNAIEDFIGFDKEAAKIWHLHLHYRMTLGEKHLKGYTVTPWTKYILNNRVYDDCGIYRSCYETELVLLIVRMALKIRLRDVGKKIGMDDLIEYQWLLGKSDGKKLFSCAEEMTDTKIARRIYSLCKNNLKRRSQLIKLQNMLREHFYKFTGYSRFESRYMRTKREIFWLFGGVKRRLRISSTKAYRRVSPSGGCVVALLGCDGAGKTTTLSYIKKEFSKKIDVLSIYFGSGDGDSSLIRRPMKLVAVKVGGKGVGHSVENEYKVSERKQISFKARMYSIAKIIWAVSLAKEKKKKLHRMTKARNNGLLVLTDRYPQIELAGYSDGPLLTRYEKSKGFLKRLAEWEYEIYKSSYKNPPDLTIKLTVPTDLAIERKPEMTKQEIENKKFAVMAMNISEYSVVIDTSKGKIETFGEVMNEIWKIL